MLAAIVANDASEALPFSAPRRPQVPFSFIAYGDVQQNYRGAHDALALRMAREPAAFVISSGDISNDEGLDYTDDFLPGIRPVAEQISFFPSPGNHDVDFGSSSSRMNFYRFFRHSYAYLSERFDNSHITPESQKLWYSFEYGPALFISLDSNFLIDEGKYKATHSLPVYRFHREQQLTWLSRQLIRADEDQSIRYIFVFFHHSPFFSDENKPFLGMGGHPGHGEMMVNQPVPALTDSKHRLYMLDLFRIHKVTAVFSGHVHYYERWRELITQGDQFVHIINWFVVGNGGVKPRGKPLYKQKSIQRLFDKKDYLRYYLDRASNLGMGWAASLDHVFPDEDDKDGRFPGYVLVSVDSDGVTFETKDSEGLLRDQGRLAGPLNLPPGLRRPANSQ